MKHISLRAAVYAALIGLVCLCTIAAIAPQVGMNGIGVNGIKSGMPSGKSTDDSPWGAGYKYCWVFYAADGYKANLAWSQAADSMGFTYTIGASSAPTFGIGDTANGMMTAAELLTVANRGIDIGSTGTHHRAQGILSHVYTNMAAYDDSLHVSTNPAWVTAITGKPVKSWESDLYYWNYQGAKQLRAEGYKSSICGYWFQHQADYDAAERERGFLAWGSPGWDRWDVSRLLPWDDVGCIYGIGGWPAEGGAGTRAIFGTASADSTPLATLQANMDAAMDSSAVHGYAPIIVMMHNYNVTRDDLENAVNYARSKGGLVTSLKNMAEIYRSKHVPRDPPYWAYYAKLDGITAADSIFWGPPAETVSCATDSFLFSRHTAAVDTTAGWAARVNTGHGYGNWKFAAQTTRPSGAYMETYFAAPPLNSTEIASGYGFNISSLYGKEVVSAQLGYYVNNEFVFTDDELNFGVVIGVTDPTMLPYMNNKQWTYTYRDSAQTQTWPTAFNTYQRFHDIGPYVYPIVHAGWTAGMHRVNVTEYVKHAVDDSTTMAGFVMWGLKINNATPEYGELSTFKANILNRPFLVVKTCNASTYDTTPPGVQNIQSAVGGDGEVTLTWAAATPAEPTWYKVYRFFDGATDTTLLTTTVELTYTDHTAINGSPHNYFITAVDMEGNESKDSNHIAASPPPGDIMIVNGGVRPPYYALWYEDPGSLSDAEINAKVDSLSAFDCVVLGEPCMRGVDSEPAFANIVDKLRAKNDDIIVLAYMNPWHMRVSDETADRAPYKRMLQFAASFADSTGFAQEVGNETVVWGKTYPNTLILNVMKAAAADTVAKIWVDAYQYLATGVSDNEYTGLFIDDVSLRPPYDFWNSYAHLGSDKAYNIIDLDKDTTDAFVDDEDEQDAWQDYMLALTKAIRREFAQRGLSNRLLLANSAFGHSTSPSATGTGIMALLDGNMVEGCNVWWPGNAASTDTLTTMFGIRDLMTHAQVAPPMQFYHVITDSSVQYQAEILALATDTWASATDGYLNDQPGNNHVPAAPRRLPDTAGGSAYGFTSGTPDTLEVQAGSLYGRLLLARNSGFADSTYTVWPYVVYNTATNDTISRSLFYERAGEIGAPPDPEFLTLNGDEQITVIFRPAQLYGDGGSQYDAGWTTDLRRVGIQIAPAVGDADTAYVDPDTLNYWSPAVEGGDGDDWLFWTNTGLTNGLEYCYRMWAEDWVGNKSNVITHADQCRTPEDNASPQTPENLIAKGWLGAVDLDWSDSRDIDMAGYIINRSDGGEFGQLKTILADAWNPHSYTTDSTAVSGQTYEYYVEAFDDEDNLSAPSDTVSGGWMGTGGTYPPPSNVRALADNPSGSTAVVVYPPTDVTGLSSYSIYRGPKATLAAVDTTACTIYKVGLPPDAFNGCVFYDTHATNGAAPDTAFQYTACAVYSGHRSTKYAVPAWALSTGGISAQTPDVRADGTGTNIAVSIAGIAGCDSTRIFRGTTAGTQTHLTTVAYYSGVYFDTTALPNTDYYYKVRNSASAGTILTQFSNVSGPVRWVSVPAGSPAISGVTGTIANGQSVVISGANFGSKTLAAPKVWDNFDSGTNGGVIATGTNWTRTSGDEATTRAPRYNNSTSHSGSNSAFCAFDGSSYRSSFSVVDATRLGHEFYLDAWTWYVPGTNPSRSWKPWIMYDNTGGESVLIDWYGGCNNRSTVSTHSGGSNIAGQTWLDINEGMDGSVLDFASGWHHFKVYAKLSSPAGTRTGVSWVWLDGNVICDRTNMYLLAADATRTWGDLAIGCYTSHDQRDNTGGVQAGCYEPVGNPYQYWDDVYVDGTRSRVEIGNNATYSLCTHTEIQIPSAWASNGTSITATLNTGTFTNGTAYLFVVDSDGNASAGQSITIANP